jgi:hypothetical protein
MLLLSLSHPRFGTRQFAAMPARNGLAMAIESKEVRLAPAVPQVMKLWAAATVNTYNFAV